MKAGQFLEEVQGNPGLLPKVAIVVYRFGNWVCECMRMPLVRQVLYVLYRLIDFLLLKLLLNTDLPGGATFGPGLKIYHPYGILVNDGAVVGSDCTLRAGVVIGNKGEADGRCPVIGDSCDFGAGAKVIIGGVTLGDGCVVGANAVVTKSFPAGTVLGGVPAKALGRREGALDPYERKVVEDGFEGPSS